VTLRLAIRVRDAESCEPIRNAVVDIWQSDADGHYSGVDDNETFLRGAQVTNSSGIVEFLTIYPGWYQGRTVHIHAKVHLDKQTVLTTQLFFDEATQRAVYDSGSYAAGTPITRATASATRLSSWPPARGRWLPRDDLGRRGSRLSRRPRRDPLSIGVGWPPGQRFRSLAKTSWDEPRVDPK
jgi:Dioxygenase